VRQEAHICNVRLMERRDKPSSQKKQSHTSMGLRSSQRAEGRATRRCGAWLEKR